MILNIYHSDLSHYVSESSSKKKSGTLYQNETVCLLVWWAVVWQLDLQLPVQSVPSPTKVVSSNSVHGKVYSIQYYVIKVVKWLVTGRWFPPGTPVCPTNIIIKTDRHDITEILLKVALNTKNQANLCLFARYSRFTFCVRQYVQTLVLVFFVSFLIFLPSFQC